MNSGEIVDKDLELFAAKVSTGDPCGGGAVGWPGHETVNGSLCVFYSFTMENLSVSLSYL